MVEKRKLIESEHPKEKGKWFALREVVK
jgi:hypothetical protein